MKTFIALLSLVYLGIEVASAGTTNLLANSGFETGTTAGWPAPPSYGTCAVVANNAHSGTYAGRISYDSQFAQVAASLLPNTTYTCTVWVKQTTAGQTAYFIIGGYDASGASINQSASSTTYTQLTFTFRTGSTNTSAQIEVWQGGANPAYCDDFSLTALMTADGSGTGAPVGDTTGIQAFRISDCLQRFCANTFSVLTYDGYGWNWGGGSLSYSSATTAAAINYLTAGSGLTMNIREYHHDGAGSPLTPLQMTWMREVYQATGSPFTIAIGMWGEAWDVPGIAAIVQDSVNSGLNYVKWVEGINEPDQPNPNYGNAWTPPNVAAAAQVLLYQQIHAITTNVTVLGPSVTDTRAGGIEGSLTSYLGTNLQSVLTNSDADNLHVYPQQSPNADDGSGRGGQLADFTIGYENALPGKPLINTEWHPTYYSSIHKFDANYDAYWGPIYLLSAFQDFDWKACFYFELFDWDSTTKDGLFDPTGTIPKPEAQAFHALFQLTGDLGTNKLTFKPGRLDVTVSGLPAAPSGSLYAGGRIALFQNSAQQYFLMIWNEQNNTNAATRPVTVMFNSHNMSKVEEFNITGGNEAPVQSLTNVHTMTVNLDTSLRLLRITYRGAGRLQGVSVSGKHPTLAFGGLSGYGYNVQRSADLVNWATIWTTNAPAGGLFNFTDTFGNLGGLPPASAYYRLSFNP